MGYILYVNCGGKGTGMVGPQTVVSMYLDGQRCVFVTDHETIWWIFCYRNVSGVPGIIYLA